MSSIVERTLTFTGSQAKTYMTSTGGVQLADDLAIKSDCIANIEAIISSSASGTAVYNSTSKNILYPNSTAHPIKLTGYFDYYNQNSSTLQLIYNGATILTMPNKNSNTSYSFESVDPAVLSSTKSSDIHWYLKRSSVFSSVYFTDPFAFTLSFIRYDFSASAGTGIASATVSSATGYDGDTVTFSCVIPTDYVFDGWYSGSTLVSSSQTYTHTVNGADLSLTAKAVATTTKTLTVTYNGLSIAAGSVVPPITVSYNGTQIASVASGQTKTLNCSGKLMSGNVVVGGKTLNCSGKIMSGNVVVSVS